MQKFLRIKHAMKLLICISVAFELECPLYITKIANYCLSLNLFSLINYYFLIILFFIFLPRDLSNNAIMSVQGNAFSQMKKLKEL